VSCSQRCYIPRNVIYSLGMGFIVSRRFIYKGNFLPLACANIGGKGGMREGRKEGRKEPMLHPTQPTFVSWNNRAQGLDPTYEI